MDVTTLVKVQVVDIADAPTRGYLTTQSQQC